MPVAAQDLHDVGEVLLVLAVVGRHPLDGVGEQRAVEGVAPGVELIDGALGLGRVALLDDPQEGAVGVAHDPPETREVAPRGQHGDRVARRLVPARQFAERLPAQQRHVTVGHDDRACQGANGLDDHPHGVPGAKLLLLDDDVRPRYRGDGRRAHLFLGVPDHDREPLGGEVARGRERVPEQGPPAQRVQHLGGAGLHPGALAGGKHHNRGQGSFAH